MSIRQKLMISKMGDKHDLNISTTYYISIELKYQILIYIINKFTK